jgi:peptide deformylase
MRGRVSRPTRVHVEALARDGRPLRFDTEGFHARVVQHECDHLDGLLYVDRMTSMASLTFLSEFQRHWLRRL